VDNKVREFVDVGLVAGVGQMDMKINYRVAYFIPVSYNNENILDTVGQIR